MVKQTHLLSYLRETTFGSNTIAADTQTYKLGHFFKSQVLPSPQCDVRSISHLNDRDASYLISGMHRLKSDMQFYMVNALPLYYAMGQSTNTDKTTYWEHAISGVWAAGANKFDLPSFTLHHEATDGTTEYVREYFGNKVDRVNIIAQRNKPVICEMGLLASSLVATGNELTTAPIFPATKNEKPWVGNNFTLTWDDGSVTTVESFNIGIQNNLQPIWVDNTRLPKYIFEGDRKYMVNLNLTISENNNIFINRVLDQVAKTLVIKMTRATHDFMQFTFADSVVVSQNESVHFISEGLFFVPIVIMPKTCTIAIEDNIANTFYPTQS